MGPIISSQLTQQAILLVILGSLGILLWVSLRFQDVKFGVSAIAALLHDVIVVVGDLRDPGHALRGRRSIRSS